MPINDQYLFQLSIVDLQQNMNFIERLALVQNLMSTDSERCLQEISAPAFLNSIFTQELRAIVHMLENYLQKKNNPGKGQQAAKLTLQPQIIVGLYSVVIMRSSMINIRQENVHHLPSQYDPNAQTTFNSKLAVQTLSKIYRGLTESDPTKQIICGLLLKIKGFNNYKLIAKDLSPLYISDQTMGVHFSNIKSQCPNLLDTQLSKHKAHWSKYLRFKPLSLARMKELVQLVMSSQDQNNHLEILAAVTEIEEETKYLLSRLDLIEENQQQEQFSIEEFTSLADILQGMIAEKIAATTPVSRKISKIEHQLVQYDSKQEMHRHYLKLYHHLLLVVNKSISSLGNNWFRKIKWLYQFVIGQLTSFDIKNHNSHEAIAKEHSKIIILLIQMVTNYLVTFKKGLFPQGKLQEIMFSGQYSIYKLIEALLYNEYPFNEAETAKYRNYQKQRKHHDSKQKQQLIDIVNYNMKSLNVHPHWDNLLSKIIPNLKQSYQFCHSLFYQALYFLLKYLELTRNYQDTPKLLLMLANAKNSFFVAHKPADQLISQIKSLIYPEKKDIKAGIEYFCQEYFQEHLHYQQERLKEESAKKEKQMDIYRTEDVMVRNNRPLLHNFSIFKKTQSYDSIVEGWDNYESVRDSHKDYSPSGLKESMNKEQHPMFQSVQSSNQMKDEVFYSVNESKAEKMRQILSQRKASKEQVIQSSKPELEQNQLALPEF